MKLRVIAVLSLVLFASAVPALAKPKSASVTAIHRCTPDCSSDSINQNDIVSGTIKIDFSATSGIVLDRVRLEAKPPSLSEYVCLTQLYGNQMTQMNASFDWSTPIWPNPSKQTPQTRCPETVKHIHGYPAENGVYRVRVVAYDVNDQSETHSSDFLMQLANVASAPRWEGTPTPTTTNGKPVVLVRWKLNLETDISEYHFRRTDPDGHTIEFAVDAKNPDHQGCYVNTLYYGCPDSAFGGAGSGMYRYAILALRPTPGASQRCDLSSQACSASPPSDSQSVNVTVPATASPTGTASASASAIAHPSIVPAAISSYTASPAAQAQSVPTGSKHRSFPLAWILLPTLAVLASGAFVIWRKVRNHPTENTLP